MIKTLVFMAASAVLVFAHEVEHGHTEVSHLDGKIADSTGVAHSEGKLGDTIGVAHLEGKFGDSIVKGDLTFTMQAKDQMLITGTIVGMPPGQYGLNIHEHGDLSNGCISTLGHFNPHGHVHGHPTYEHRHVGELGNIEFDKAHVAHVKLTDHRVKLWGEEGIVGRAVVLSSRLDDHGKTEHPLTKVDNNTGERVACGVIGIKSH